MVCVVSWKNAVYMYFGPGGAVPPPRVSLFSKLKRSKPLPENSGSGFLWIRVVYLNSFLQIFSSSISTLSMMICPRAAEEERAGASTPVSGTAPWGTG